MPVTKKVESKKESCPCHCHHGSHGSDAVYGLGFIGALIYYLPHAASFSIGLLDFLKSLVWPAMLIFRVFTTLKM